MANENLLFDLVGKVKMDTSEFETAASNVTRTLDSLKLKMSGIENTKMPGFSSSYIPKTSGLDGLNLGGFDIGGIAADAGGTALGNLASDTIKGIGNSIKTIFTNGNKADLPVNLVLADGTTIQGQIDTLVGNSIPNIPVNVVPSFADVESTTQQMNEWASSLDLDFVEAHLIVSAPDSDLVAEQINEVIADIQSKINPLVVQLEIPNVTAQSGETPTAHDPLAATRKITIEELDASIKQVASVSGFFKSKRMQTANRGTYSGTYENTGIPGVMFGVGSWLSDVFKDESSAGDAVAGLLDAAKKGPDGFSDFFIEQGVGATGDAAGALMQDFANWLSPSPITRTEDVIIGGEKHQYPAYLDTEGKGWFYQPTREDFTFGLAPRDQKVIQNKSWGVHGGFYEVLPTASSFFSSVGKTLEGFEPGSAIPVSGLGGAFDADNILEILQEQFPEFTFEAVPEIPEESANDLQSSLDGMGLTVPVTPVLTGSMGGYDWAGIVGDINGSGPQPINIGGEMKRALSGMSVTLNDNLVGVVSESIGRQIVGSV